jgi:hypothetical protein
MPSFWETLGPGIDADVRISIVAVCLDRDGDTDSDGDRSLDASSSRGQDMSHRDVVQEHDYEALR